MRIFPKHVIKVPWSIFNTTQFLSIDAKIKYVQKLIVSYKTSSTFYYFDHQIDGSEVP